MREPGTVPREPFSARSTHIACKRLGILTDRPYGAPSPSPDFVRSTTYSVQAFHHFVRYMAFVFLFHVKILLVHWFHDLCHPCVPWLRSFVRSSFRSIHDGLAFVGSCVCPLVPRNQFVRLFPRVFRKSLPKLLPSLKLR